ncbi:MAG: hypothetical protein MUF00_20750 [Gemmatimonadaceae bacterium]|jgi:hypothetical protein|nr:hypothetical protein [Gemmatimonadaceae bacterium]
MFVSDLSHDDVTDVRTRSWFRDLLRAPLVRQATQAPAPRPPKRRLVVYAFAGVLGLYAALYGVATMLASPLSSLGAASPAFPLAISASGTRSATVLVHGPDVGWHLVRVPGAASNTEAQQIPARLADATLTVISLGGGSLDLRTTGPFGSAQSLEVQGRTFTIYRTPARTGVRSRW